jgi:hypothetical protein
MSSSEGKRKKRRAPSQEDDSRAAGPQRVYEDPTATDRAIQINGDIGGSLTLNQGMLAGACSLVRNP